MKTDRRETSPSSQPVIQTDTIPDIDIYIYIYIEREREREKRIMKTDRMVVSAVGRSRPAAPWSRSGLPAPRRVRYLYIYIYIYIYIHTHIIEC